MRHIASSCIRRLIARRRARAIAARAARAAELNLTSFATLAIRLGRSRCCVSSGLDERASATRHARTDLSSAAPRRRGWRRCGCSSPLATTSSCTRTMEPSARGVCAGSASASSERSRSRRYCGGRRRDQAASSKRSCASTTCLAGHSSSRFRGAQRRRSPTPTSCRRQPSPRRGPPSRTRGTSSLRHLRSVRARARRD